MRVLIVEDEVLIAWELAGIVEDLGYTVCGTAMNAKEAERMAGETEPHLILMDVRLGSGEDGIVAATRILEKRDVPIIFCTAFADPPTVARISRVGAAGLVSKPVRPQEIEALVHAALKSAQS